MSAPPFVGIPACSHSVLEDLCTASGMPVKRVSMKNRIRFHLSPKRARLSNAHSTWEPLSTRPEYAPKDAPRTGASFACISSDQKFSGISVEPLQRINAKSRAVTGGNALRQTSSPPISPARAEHPLPLPAAVIIPNFRRCGKCPRAKKIAADI